MMEIFDWTFYDVWQWVVSDEPPIITKTITVGIITWIGLQIKKWLEYIYKEVHRNVFSTVYLDSQDHMYQAFSMWYQAHHPESFRQVHAILEDEYKDGIRTFVLRFIQYFDINYIRYKGKWILLKKDRTEVSQRFADKAYLDLYVITTFMGRDVLHDLIDEVVEFWNSKQEKSTGLRAVVTDRWAQARSLHVTSYKILDQVFMEGKQDLMDDINNFLGRKELYYRQGIRFKRAYLLYGPPGGGKSTLVFAIAHWLKRPVYYLNPSGFASDDSFETFVAEVEENSVILIEDVDIFWRGRYEDSSDKTGISFQSLLNTLDGLHSPSNVLIFMTTNHIEDFDEAFMRKGRMDYKMKIDHPGREMVEKYISQFFQTSGVCMPESFMGGVSMVEIQDACIKSSSPEEAIQKICYEHV